MSEDTGFQRERERQQALMSALLARDDGSALPAEWAPSAVPPQRGLQAYRAHAGATAERALAVTFPTVQALIGEESFAALARAFWHAQPPERGDLACFGETLPAFIAASAQLADVPYLPDVARLEALLATAERAADDAADLSTLGLLAELEPSQLQLDLVPGTALLSSAHPVVSVWLAHQAGGDVSARLAQARAAIAAGMDEHALVWRQGWRATAVTVNAATAHWTRSLLRGDTLAAAWAEAGEGFDFEPWLVQALQQGWLARACCVAG